MRMPEMEKLAKVTVIYCAWSTLGSVEKTHGK